MDNAKDVSKPKEERLEEKEKIEAEAQRSLAVAEMKKAHKLIEETEKSRKLPALRSICQRIDDQIGENTLEFITMFGEDVFSDNPIVVESIKMDLLSRFQTYESIHYDLQRTVNINDDDMNKLFPKVRIDITNGYSVCGSLFTMTRQLKQMRLYCERMLI